MLDTSQFRMISVSYVAENKLRTSNEVEISLVESLPFVNGELASDLTQETVDAVNSRGDALSFSVFTANTIRAKWLGDGTNRVTAPDVRRGEKVTVFQFGTTDQYFWQAFNEPGVPNPRKLETVVTAYSNTKDETDNEPNPDNSWIHEVNTHEKTVTFKTNKADGEPFAYTTQIDAKTGNVVVADDIGNYIQMNSKDQIIELETASGARFELNKADMTLTCENYTLNATKSIKTNTPQATHNDKVVKYVGSTFDMNMDSVTYNASTYAINSSTVTVDGGSFTHNGTNVGNTHYHIGNQGKPTSSPK